MKVSLDDIPASFICTGGVLVTQVPRDWVGRQPQLRHSTKNYKAGTPQV
jgi:hypothetical protein